MSESEPGFPAAPTVVPEYPSDPLEDTGTAIPGPEEFMRMKPARTALRCRQDGNFLIAMTPDRRIFFLNDPGGRIYLELDGGRSIAQIMSALKAGNTEAPPDDESIRIFFADLMRYRLVR